MNTPVSTSMDTADRLVDKLVAKSGVPIASRGAVLAAIRERDFKWADAMRDALRTQARIMDENFRSRSSR